MSGIARVLRRRATEAEKLLWSRLRNRQIGGVKFKRQVPITQWTVPLAAPLAPGTYRLRITSAPGLNGRRIDVEREIRVRPPAPTALRDSSARRP